MIRVVAAAFLALLPQATLAQERLPAPVLKSAELIQPTRRYDHGVLGDAVEWAAMRLIYDLCVTCGSIKEKSVLHVLPASRVFEDATARLADLDGDGLIEVVVVETDIALGASLAVYDINGKRAATPFIGQTHRWLAPAGIGDFDGDGRVEIAYVDRPHLVQELVFVRLVDDRLIEIARAPGFSNHRIGDPQITGAVQRGCDSGSDALILPDADWRTLRRVTLRGDQIVSSPIGPITPSENWGRDWADPAGC